MALVDYAAKRYDIRFTKGDDIVEKLYFYDSDGEALSLDGYEFLSQVRDVLGELIAEFGVTVGDGFITRVLDSETTATLPDGCFHDLQWTDPDGYVRTWISGKMIPTSEYSF